jgi:predicted amidohydrolase YtcJ
MHALSFAGLVLEFLGRDIDSQLDLLEQGGQEYLKSGITSVHDASSLPDILRIYHEAERRGRLPMRVYPMPLLDYSRPVLDAGVRTGFGSDRLRMGPIKVISDGSLSGRTAAVSEPYRNTPGNGMLAMDQQKMNGIVREIHEKGFQAAIHAIGDRAVDQVVTAYEQVIPLGSGNPLRHRIEHAGILNRSLIDRIAERDLVVATQPRFLYEQGDGFLASCGPERIRRVYPFRSLLRSGVRVAGSSDCPVVCHAPLLGIRDAVMRRTEAGEVLAPEECLTPAEALRLFTIDAARASFEEDRKGSLRPGKLADLVVLSEDPLSVEPERIGEIRVRMTILDGEVVYSDGNGGEVRRGGQ